MPGLKTSAVSPERAQRHRNLINWLKADCNPGSQDVAHRLVGCRTGTFAAKYVPLYTTEDKLDFIGSTIACDKHLCDLCGTEKACRFRERYLALVEQHWDLGTHVHFIPTIQHEPGDRWFDLKNMLKFIWEGIYQLSWWKKAVIGYIRNDDVSHDINGFHVHQHIIITFKFGININEFATKIEKYYSQIATKFRYTISWKSNLNWWKPIGDKDGLYKAINYSTKSLRWEDFRNGVEPGSLTGASAYSEVWNSCRDHHWHSSAGIWRRTKPLSTPAPIQKHQRNPSMGIPLRTWHCMTPSQRDALRACVGKSNGVKVVQALLGDGSGLITLPVHSPANGSKGRKRGKA